MNKCTTCKELDEVPTLVTMIKELSNKTDDQLKTWYHRRQHKLFVFKQVDPWTVK